MTAKAQHYDVIRKPVITEKSTMASENGAVVFEVAIDAAKPQIKEAVEALFGVKVKAVNTTITKGKVKRFRGQLGRRKDVKKAYVTLEEGPTVMTNLVDCDLDAIEIGQAVEVTFRPADDGQAIPMFKPVGG